MDFYEVINKRRTIREFQNAPIDDDTISRIIDAGMKAPTNDHMRDWHFIVMKDKQVVLKLIEKIPMKISDEEVNTILRDWNLNDTCQQNMYKNAIPKQYRMLAEASCVIIPLGDEESWARTVLNYPEDYRMPCFIAVGKPAENIKEIKQKEYSLHEVIHNDVW